MAEKIRLKKRQPQQIAATSVTWRSNMAKRHAVELAMKANPARHFESTADCGPAKVQITNANCGMGETSD
ncbi:hypothetical protein [Aminobacter aminovorans]|uniref:Uncharacterized protein n=1 Tax=Aminobacter aminovorans TaxID=83263 RepID=A0ABR6HDY0_AMIAI|nr:hypothetical protein [Aminobacter aminovorans]MBB3708688.1 hypothetical protein [Aminobacter aminovorans]